MLAKAFSAGLSGIEAYPVEIETDVPGQGLPILDIAGLADASVKESRMRVKAAVKNSGFKWPQGRMTVNLAPGNVKKEGPGFDLAIALGVLGASGQIDPESLRNRCFLGELSLDGLVRPVKGVLPVCLAMKKQKLTDLVVPWQNREEAALIPEVNTYPVKSLVQAAEFLNSPEMTRPFKVELEQIMERGSGYPVDFSDVSGQAAAKRAIEVAAAGNHNIMLIGPPGCGKTMLARRIPTILPGLTLQEALEVTRIHSAAGLLKAAEPVIARHPFRSPHHTISYSSLVGGGAGPQPGEISLAHDGVLFLDELPEFHRDVLATLRQPLEEGSIRVSRRNKSCVFPSSFMLVCAMNPCPCGYLTDPRKACRCSSTAVERYSGKISGPLLERIDIHIPVAAVEYRDLADPGSAEDSSLIRERVEKARAIQRERYAEEGIMNNAQMSHRQVRRFCQLGKKEEGLLKTAMTELNLSARVYDKVLKVARTVADLSGNSPIDTGHLSEAIHYCARNP